MKIRSLLTLAVAAATSQMAFAQAKAPETMVVAASAPGMAVLAHKTTVTATVVSIDHAKREATLKAANGKLIDVVVPPEAKKFDQIGVGDLVTVEYAQALALELMKHGGGVRESSAMAASAAAPAGAVAGGAVGRRVTILANVVAVDTKTSVVTLRGPKGNTVDLTVADPGQLKLIKKGDQVEATYAEAVAITVEPAAKPAKTK